MKTRMVFILTLGMFLNSAALADKCPQLSGMYQCRNGRLTVTQSGGLRKVVKYQWMSPVAGVRVYSASLSGVKNADGPYGICRSKSLYLTESLEDLSGSNRYSLSLTGNYVVTGFMGEPIETCVRIR